MSKRRKHEKIYEYTCTITGETFKVTKPAPHPDELVSVKAYYDLHPEKDDRPEVIRNMVQADEEQKKKKEEMQEQLAAELAAKPPSSQSRDRSRK